MEVCMRNFQNGCLVTSGNAPLGLPPIGQGRRMVGPNGPKSGHSRMDAARCLLTGTTSAVLTGAAAGAPSGAATIIVNGAAVMPAARATARGPPHRAPTKPRHRIDLPGSASAHADSTRRRADGCNHRPDLPTRALPLQRKRHRGKPIFYLRNPQFGSVPKPLMVAPTYGARPVSALATMAAALATGLFLGFALAATLATSMQSHIQERVQRKVLYWQTETARAREAAEQVARWHEAREEALSRPPAGRE